MSGEAWAIVLFVVAVFISVTGKLHTYEDCDRDVACYEHYEERDYP